MIQRRCFSQILWAIFLTAIAAPAPIATLFWFGMVANRPPDPLGALVSLPLMVAYGAFAGSFVSLPAALINALLIELIAIFWTKHISASLICGAFSGALGAACLTIRLGENSIRVDDEAATFIIAFSIIGAFMGPLYRHSAGLSTLASKDP